MAVALGFPFLQLVRLCIDCDQQAGQPTDQEMPRSIPSQPAAALLSLGLISATPKDPPGKAPGCVDMQPCPPGGGTPTDSL